MERTRVGLIDDKVSNVTAVESKLSRMGYETVRVSDYRDFSEDFTHIILPGVGAFDSSVGSLKASGIFYHLKEVISKGVPTLGICLGMQLLCEGSEEGEESGLAFFPIKAKKLRHFDSDTMCPSLHVGYKSAVGKSCLISDTGDQSAFFYFSHTFAIIDKNCVFSECTTSYCCGEFVSILAKDNVIGVQFHPERSHKPGEYLLRRFLTQHSDV